MNRDEEQLEKYVKRRTKKRSTKMKMSGKGMKRFGGGAKKKD